MMKLFCKKNNIALVFVSIFIAITISLSAQAQVIITQTQDLSFGTFGFKSFNTTLRINIQNNGGYTANPNTIIYIAPTRGEFTLTGGPANSPYTITFAPSTVLTGPGADFTIDNIRIRPNTLQTNAAGTDTFNVMARLTSLSGGAIYNNGHYDTDYDLIINF